MSGTHAASLISCEDWSDTDIFILIDLKAAKKVTVELNLRGNCAITGNASITYIEK